MVKQLQQHPLRIKVIAAGVLSAISDIVSQKLTGIQKLQLRRLLLKVWISGQPWVNVKAKDKKDYPSVQYTAWTNNELNRRPRLLWGG
ncbi:Peroxisomal membrane protein PMP22 [Glycine soja]|nr:Peroxisomal membrane protein PMP22 [Glycine soja]